MSCERAAEETRKEFVKQIGNISGKRLLNLFSNSSAARFRKPTRPRRTSAMLRITFPKGSACPVRGNGCAR
jgi:hypothetical protein